MKFKRLADMFGRKPLRPPCLRHRACSPRPQAKTHHSPHWPRGYILLLFSPRPVLLHLISGFVVLILLDSKLILILIQRLVVLVVALLGQRFVLLVVLGPGLLLLLSPA